MSFTVDGEEPSSLADSPRWREIRYDLQVAGSTVTVLRQGEAVSQQFSTVEQGRLQAPSSLCEYLEDIGLSRVDAHMICIALEKGSPVSGIFAIG